MMDKQNREDFLNSIATKAGRPRHQLADHPFKPLNNLPEATLSGKTQDQLLQIAKKSSEVVHVDFETTTTVCLADLLRKYVQHKNIQQLILPTTDVWEKFKLTDWQKDTGVTTNYWIPQAPRKENIQRAQDADGAIGFADFLLAESGTIAVATTPGQGRAFHFLPTHYLSIVPKSKIVPRSRQAMVAYAEKFSNGQLKTSNINLITGPSNSGDIEMVLVVGVHGPLDMTYVVVEDL
ncbi:LutC/YkgG family protein [Liquorilactobacillus sicerae]|uniref:LutC/YkgG family protein n=1 Tax=Liquorilactobacillus sicerae TaxID=1416943 RepID=UPI0024818239|nr:lactate utilization protein C [Liquorilactobacillus sicerae]